MSRTLSLISPNGPYVSPNQLVTAPIATNVGFNVNDFVYAYGNNQVGSLGATIGLGAVSTFIAGTKVNGAVANGFAPTSVMAGPYSATGLYTGTTRTQGNIFQPQTDLSVNNASFIRMCVLNSGNIALVFYDSVDAQLKYAIYTKSGAIVKSPTYLINVFNGQNTVSISAMTDGGFVIAHGYGSQNLYSRFDSAGDVLINSQTLQSSLQSATTYLNVAATSSGGFMFAGNNSNSQLYVSSYSSSNAHLGTVTVTSASAVYDTNIIGLSNGNVAIVGNINGNTMMRVIFSPSLAEVSPWNSIVSGSNIPFNMAAFDGGFVFSNRNPSTGYPRMISMRNDGSSISTSLQPYGGGGDNEMVAVGENNTAYLLFYQSGTTWYVIKYVDINSTSMKSETVYAVSNLSGSYRPNNFYSALNGSFYYAGLFNSKPAFLTFNTATYTQNTTVLSNQGLYTPPNGYYFLGIAATTAAANSSGLVYTNGGIALPSTYPSVTTGYAFDYQSNGLWAQRGTINGRAINLQGAQ